MVQPDNSSLSVARQCRLLSIGRSSDYHGPVGESAWTLSLMAAIDRQFLETPFYGVRQMTWHPRARGDPVNVKRVRRLMRLMGLTPIYQRPRTSVPAPGHKIDPYLPRGVTVDRPNQVRCADIRSIPLAKGFLYLVAVMDGWSRTVLAWRLSNTMDVQFRVDALEEALDRHGPPAILTPIGAARSRPGHGRNGCVTPASASRWTGGGASSTTFLGLTPCHWHDGSSSVIERLWRSLKYECVTLHAFSGGRDTRQGIGAD